MLHKLLIYHPDSKVYHEILAKGLPGLEIRPATHPEEAWDFIEEAEIILSWQTREDLLKRAKGLRWFASMAAGNEDLVKNPHLPRGVTLTKANSQNLWDGKLLSHHLYKRYRVNVGQRQCQRLFHQLGFRLRKPRPLIAQAYPERQAQYKKTGSPGQKKRS